ncbi:MAG: hypothetical protein HYX51_06140 [Chloroflexi bacterium]|nr:hypothetical protein [Chloroflexota bacterium]
MALEEVLLLLLDLKRGRFGIRPLRVDWTRVPLAPALLAEQLRESATEAAIISS